jgi:hypothetical protein
LRDGVTSSRAGSPGASHARGVAGFASEATGAGGGAGAALGGALGGGGALAGALAAGASSPSRRTSEYERERVTDAAQVVSWMMNWYCPVSVIVMLESVAEVVVTTVARRGSFAADAHRVRQARAFPDAEWLVRASPGICSQQSAVLHARPAPEIMSSEPDCLICTAPPGAPSGFGFGPHASPHEVIDHRSETPLADHEPLSVGSPSARPGRSAAATARRKASEARSGRRTVER